MSAKLFDDLQIDSGFCRWHLTPANTIHSDQISIKSNQQNSRVFGFLLGFVNRNTIFYVFIIIVVGLVVAAYFSNRLLDSMMCERSLMNKTQRVVLLSVNLIRWVSEWTGDGKTSSWSLTLLARAIFETTAQIMFWRENLPFYIGKRKQKTAIWPIPPPADRQKNLIGSNVNGFIWLLCTKSF